MTHIFRIIELLIILLIVWITFVQLDSRLRLIEAKYLEPQPLFILHPQKYSSTEVHVNGEKVKMEENK